MRKQSRSLLPRPPPVEVFRIPIAPTRCYEATRPISFSVHTPKYRGSHSWPFGHIAWNRLLRFLTTVRVACTHVDVVPCATVLELYMSYVLFSGARFNTGLGDNMRGGWLSIQLDRFTKALQSLQSLCALEPVVAAKLTGRQGCGWAGRFGISVLHQLILPGLLIPGWVDVQSRLQAVLEAPPQLPGAESHAAELWRRLKLGEDHSQMSDVGKLPSHSILWDVLPVPR
eukprot:349101-Amphidinium_carterae.1